LLIRGGAKNQEEACIISSLSYKLRQP
jgi:hypothetical protein